MYLRRYKRTAVVLLSVGFAVWYLAFWISGHGDRTEVLKVTGRDTLDNAKKGMDFFEDLGSYLMDDSDDLTGGGEYPDDEVLSYNGHAYDSPRATTEMLPGKMLITGNGLPAEPAEVDNTRVHLLLLAYMRTGSSMTGRILKLSKSGVFYWFEPLHWLERHYVTGGHPEEAYKNTSLVEEFTWSSVATGNISALLNCDMEHVYGRAFLDYFMKFSPATQAFARCFADAVNDTRAWDECIRNMTTVCRRDYPVTAIKCIRLTLSRALEVMRQDPKVKVVHLFRDPRAVLMSRSKLGYSKWSALETEAALVCSRMIQDVHTTLTQMKDPDVGQRYAVVRYEDIVMDPVGAVQRVYEFMELQPTEDELSATTKMIIGNKKNRTAAEVVQSWRNSISLQDSRVISSACRDVLTHVGYRLDFADETELRNLSVPSFGEPPPDIAKHLLLRARQS